MQTFPLSILDLVPVVSGSTATQALQNALDLARLADRLGYTRLWYAEHHNMPGVASSAPEVLIGAAARETARLRVGSGGVMLPNHPPLKVVEWFRTLEALYPGRIDLGIGRAPGTDGLTALALRRSREALTSDDFTAHLAEMLAFANGGFPDDHPFHAIRATPVAVPLPPLYLLGSSDYSAQVAGQLGVGFAFARHINPDGAEEAIGLYREQFAPSGQLARPHVILATSVICADTDAEADRLATSADLSFLRLRSGRPDLLPSPEEAAAYSYTPLERAQVAAGRARHLVGAPATVFPQLRAIAEWAGADELMITSNIHDHAARLRSFTLLAEAFDPAAGPVAAAVSAD